MRRGTRRGQAVADALRITVPDAEMLPRGNGPRSSPSSGPPSAASSASGTSGSPGSATFPPGVSTGAPVPTTGAAPPAVTSGATQTSLGPGAPAETGTASTAPPAIATSAGTLPTTLLPGVVQPTSLSTSQTAGRQLSPESTASGQPSRQSDTDGLSEAQSSGGPQPMSKVGIGFGVVGAVGFLVGFGFLLWYFRKRLKRARGTDRSRGFSSPPPPASNKSDSRIMNELMVASYQADQRPNSYEYPGGYMDEKRQTAYAHDEVPGLERPAPAAQHGQKHSVSSWLGSHTPEMLNPLTARASMTSSAAGLKTPGLPREAEGTMPPVPQMDPRYQQEGQQPMTFIPVPRQQLPAEYYYPINPNPERAPPPPGRMSMARTETTTRTSGTWNTWGVEQRRPDPNANSGWKGRLGLQ